MFVLLELIIIAFALAMDASAVSLVYGAKCLPFRWKFSLFTSLIFAIAQGIMPVLGWFFGELIIDKLYHIDHWLSFAILALIGIKFIIDANDNKKTEPCCTISLWPILLAAIATSIDAAAMGLGFAIMHEPIILAATVIAVVTFICSIIASRIGAHLGQGLGPNLMRIGGVVLILMGFKILYEHLIVNGENWRFWLGT